MPSPFIRHAPRRRSPFVITCEHARPGLPQTRSLNAAERTILNSHWGWDLGAWAISRESATLLGCGATGGRFTRLWIDLNRRVDDPTVIRTEVEGEALRWNQPLSQREHLDRVREVHQPYHNEVDAEIAHRLSHGIRPLLLAVHSFTPVWNGRPRNFDIGVLYDESGGEARRFARVFRDAGLRVRYNEPYSGKRGLMYSIDRHGRHYDLPNLELELNQALFDDPRATARLAPIVAQAMHEARR